MSIITACIRVCCLPLWEFTDIFFPFQKKIEFRGSSHSQLRVLSGCHVLDYLRHLSSAHVCVPRFGPSGADIGPRERRQAGTVR